MRLLLIVVATAWAFAVGQEVTPLDVAAFTAEVDEAKHNGVWLVSFCDAVEAEAPCTDLAAEFEKAAAKLDGIVSVGAVDCGPDADAALCRKQGVTQIPRVVAYGELKRNPYTKKNYREVRPYAGPTPFRAKALVDFATALLPEENVEKVAPGAASLAPDAALPQAVLFTTKSKVPPMFKAAALRLKGRMLFHVTTDSDADLPGNMGVETWPAVVVQQPDGAKVPFTGELKAAALGEFLEGLAVDAPASEGASEGGDAKNEKAAKKAPAVAEVSPADFEDKVIDSEPAWLVGFVRPSDACEDQLAAWRKAAGSLAAQVSVGEVDAGTAAGKALAQEHGASLDGDTCVSPVVFAFGDQKADSEAERYDGDAADAKALASFVHASLPDMVFPLSMSSFENFLREGYTMPKVALCHKKDETPGVYKALAISLREKMVFGTVDASETQMREQLKCTKDTMLNVFIGVPKKMEDGSDGMAMQSVQYQGKFKFELMHMWLSQFVAKEQQAGGAPPPRDEPMDVASVETVDGPDGFDAHCGSRLGLCVLGLDTTGGSAAVAMLKELAPKRAGQPFSFVSMDASRQPAVLEAFGLEPSELPTAVVVSPKRLRYAPLRGALSAESVDALLDGVLSGKSPTSPLSALPELVQGGVDAGAGAEEPVEEEFSLDDIMGEELEGSLGSKADLLAEADAEIAAREAEEKAAKEASSKKSKKKSSKKSKKKKSKAKSDEL